MSSAVVGFVRTRSARGLTLVAAAAALVVASRRTPSRAPVALAIVLDASDSMNGRGKLARAVAAAELLIDDLGPADRLAIVVTSTRARTLVPLTSATDDARARAYAALASLTADGGTNLSAALALGAQLIDHRASGRVVLISDGDPTEGERDPAALAAQVAHLAARGASISTIAVGPDPEEALLASLATAGGGSFADDR